MVTSLHAYDTVTIRVHVAKTKNQMYFNVRFLYKDQIQLYKIS